MDIRTETIDNACVLSPDGPLDTRSAHDFERKAVAAFEAGPQHVVVDFSKVELVTSAALRVLVMLGKKLGKAQRKLLLCGLNDMVRTVLEVSGLFQAFTIVPTAKDAVAQLRGASPSPAQAAAPTHLGAQVVKLLSLFDMLEVGSAAPASPALQPLARAVLSVLSRQPTPSSR
jgi:anti-anti-sigma factor